MQQIVITNQKSGTGKQVVCGGMAPLMLIAGPCQIESLDHALFCAEKLKTMAAQAGMGFVYKSSYDKANRTSAKTARGVGIDVGLEILARVKACLLYTSPSPRDYAASRMPSSA